MTGLINDLRSAIASLQKDLEVSERAGQELGRLYKQEEQWRKNVTADRDRLKAGKFTADEIHGICHNLHGTVDVHGFARGCEQEIEKLYGVCPWAKREQYDQLTARCALLRRLLGEAWDTYITHSDVTPEFADAITDALRIT